MTVVETLQALGSWELHLKDSTPDYVVSQLGYFGHVVVIDGHLPVGYVESAGNALLAGARYVGICREQDHPDAYVRGGVGLVSWLGDEDGKAKNIESTVTLTNATLAQVVAALKPPAVTTGTVFPQADGTVRYTGSHIFQSPREALAIALAPFGAEVRVNPDFSIDVGTPSQLYNTATPDKIIKRRGVGADPDLSALGGTVDVAGSARDYSTRIVLLGQTIGTGGTPDSVFATGSVDAPSVPWKDPQGNPVALTRFISESGQTTGSVASRAQLQLNRFNRSQSSVKVTADQFEIQGSFRVGDAVYVYDPETGIVNTGIEVFFRGEKLNPDIVRVTQREWPIVDGMTVAWRTDTGTWLDLTPWVVWETAGQHELTVGDLPKTLFKQGAPNGAVQDRLDASRGNPDTVRVPKAPTGLALTTASTPNASGWDTAVITATWSAVTQYTDSTSVALSHYEVQYRPQFRSPAWTPGPGTDQLTADLPVTAALGYDVQVRAVSTGGVASAWSATASILSAADSTAPGTPSDPVVTQYLGLLRIYWNGLTSTGGPMPADFNRVDVHVGTSSSFTASAATLVSSLSAAGYAHAQAPYGSTRWVRFIAYDHNGNASASSAVVSGATVQAADGDIAALSVGKLTAGTISADVVMGGRFATALTGARREVNAVGFQAFDASNNLLINLDGVNNLLTGVFKTALTGRRIEIGAGGSTGLISFIAPDGTTAQLSSQSVSGQEIATFGVPRPSTWTYWNQFSVASTEIMTGYAKSLVLGFGGGDATDGAFTLYYLPDKTNTAPARLRLNADNASMAVYFDPAGSFTVNKRASGVTTTRVSVSDTVTVFYPNGDPSGSGQLYFNPGVIGGGGTYNSPRITFYAPTLPGGGAYAGSLVYNINSDATQYGMAAVDAGNTSYIPMKASAFTVLSDGRTKRDVVDAGSVLADVLGARVRMFRRDRQDRPHKVRVKTVKDPDGSTREELVDDGPDLSWVPPQSPLEIGLLAEEAPAQIVRPMGLPDTPDLKGIDVVQYVAWLHRGLQELAASIKGGKP